MKTIWFRRKLYGWGWTPATWQGWLSLAIYLVIIFVLSVSVDKRISIEQALLTFTLPVGIITLIFLGICFKMGETPRWQWGKRIEDDSQLLNQK